MGEMPEAHGGGSTETESAHGEVCTLTDTLTHSVLAAIDWNRYADMAGEPNLCISFEGDGQAQQHEEVCMSVTSDNHVDPLIQEVTFQRVRQHYIDYYKIEFGQGYTDEFAPSLVVKESSPDKATAERVVPEEKDRLFDFEPIDLPVERLELAGIENTMNHLEHGSELSGRETQAFVLSQLGVDKHLIGEMMGVKESTVTEYLNRVNDKVSRYQSTLDWIDQLRKE